MEAVKEAINVKGRWVNADALKVANRLLIVRGRFIRIANVREELYEDVDNPSSIIEELKKGNNKVDIFSFWQRLPETVPKYAYYMEWDNYAAVPVTTYEEWLNNQIDRNAKRAVNRSEKSGVDIRVVIPDGEFIRGIVNIFNETSIRQGKEFWHYGKGFEEVKKEIIERDLDISEFVGGYYKGQLIGFIKLIYTKGYANFAQILSMVEHRDKAPTNALIAKAIKICAEKKIPYLVYERFIYGKKGTDTLSDFKRRNGFEKIDVPRYYIPLSIKGKIVLKLKLHHGISGLIPRNMLNWIIALRGKIYSRRNFKK